jgi:hypothetical protein
MMDVGFPTSISKQIWKSRQHWLAQRQTPNAKTTTRVFAASCPGMVDEFETSPSDSLEDPMSELHDSPSPKPQITFCDNLSDPKLRAIVERSVAAHIAHSAEAAVQARTAEAERAKLVAALQVPFMKPIKEDPEATKALDELRTRQLIELDATNELRRDEQRLTAAYDDLITAPLSGQVILDVRRPPYDFTWSWFRQDGSPPHGQVIKNSTGEAGIRQKDDGVG